VRRLVTLLAVPLVACGGHSRSVTPGAAHAPAQQRQAAATPQVRRLALQAERALPAPVQLPALAVRGSEALAIGGLDASDQSVADVVRLAPGAPRVVGRLPQPVHDTGAATLGRRTYVFGGGTAAGPTAAIVALGSGAGAQLPAPSSDLEAVRVGSRILIVGGYDGAAPLRSVLAFRPGRAPRALGELPHPVRYAVAAADGSRLVVAGGTDGTRSWRDVIVFDPARGRARTLARLPHPLSHAAGAVLHGTLYVFGGRAPAPTRTITAVDLRTGRVRRAGRLPVALSDLSAVTVGGRILVAGGRDAAGRVHAELLEYR
jgi:hypothetical protein